jgi:hypothetical protein
LIDIEKRHFYLLGQPFNAQTSASFFLSPSGFAPFVIADVRPRLVRVCVSAHGVLGVSAHRTRWIEGPPPRARSSDKVPFGWLRSWRRGAKMVVFAAIAAVISQLPATSCPVEVSSQPRPRRLANIRLRSDSCCARRRCCS